MNNTHVQYIFNLETEGRRVNGVACVLCTVYVGEGELKMSPSIAVQNFLSLICRLGKNTQVHL